MPKPKHQDSGFDVKPEGEVASVAPVAKATPPLVEPPPSTPPAPPVVEVAKPKEEKVKAKPWDDHVPPAMTPQSMAGTFEAQNRACRQMRIESLCKSHPEVRELVEAYDELVDRYNQLQSEVITLRK